MKNQTSVSFQTSCGLLQKLVDTAERKSRENLKQFGGRLVLIEGGGYEKIWLETQPMGGEMYAKPGIWKRESTISCFLWKIRGRTAEFPEA